MTFEEYARHIDWSLTIGRTEPALMIIVENDNLLDAQGVRRTVEQLPQVTLRVDEHGGHGSSKGTEHLAAIEVRYDTNASGNRECSGRRRGAEQCLDN